MNFPDRVLLITNDDSSIVYIGDWNVVQASTTVNDFGNNGPAFSQTLHSTTTESSFIFPFHGTSIEVFGTVNITNPSTDPNPTWQCVLDGVSLGAPNIFNSFENNWSLCYQETIPDGAHELVVNITSQGMPLYIDFIQYRPSSDASLENSLIVINNVDPGVNFISGWTVGVEETANQTTDPGSLVVVTFIGTKLSWYGLTLVEESHDASSGEYSIDDQSFTPFQLPGLPSSFTNTAFNQLFFTTPTLEMGTHVLSAKYTGSTGQTPFTLDYLHVTNGSFLASSSPPGINPPKGTDGNFTTDPPVTPSIVHVSSSTLASTSTGSVGGNTPNREFDSASSHIGTVIKGVGGAVGGIVILGIVVFWLRNRWTKGSRYSKMKGDKTIDPFRIDVLQPSQLVSQTVAPFTSLNQSRNHSKTHTSTHPYLQDTSQNSTSDPILPLNSSIPPNPPGETSGLSLGSRSSVPLTVTVSSAHFIPARSPRNDLAPGAETGITDTDPFIQHEDSGIRLIQPLRQPPVEIPPIYSEQ